MPTREELTLKLKEKEREVRALTKARKSNLYDKLSKAINKRAKKQKVREIKIKAESYSSYFSGGVLR